MAPTDQDLGVDRTMRRAEPGGLVSYLAPAADPSLLALGPTWLSHGPGPGDDVIKPDRVWRHGPWAIKRFAPSAAVRWRLRPSPARRNLLLHSKLRPIPSPRPYLVLEARDGASLLVSEFLEGRFLGALWNAGGAPVAAFPGFLASMHARGIFHGDFHLLNALWDGGQWVLLDLEGLRHPLRAWRRRALIFDHWGRVHFSLRGARGLQASFASYLAAMDLGWDADTEWPRVVALSRRMAEERGVDPSYADRDGQDPSPWSS